MWQTRVQSLGQEDPLEKGMAAHCSILAWRIPTVHGVTKSRKDWVINTTTTNYHINWRKKPNPYIVLTKPRLVPRIRRSHWRAILGMAFKSLMSHTSWSVFEAVEFDPVYEGRHLTALSCMLSCQARVSKCWHPYFTINNVLLFVLWRIMIVVHRSAVYSIRYTEAP